MRDPSSSREALRGFAARKFILHIYIFQNIKPLSLSDFSDFEGEVDHVDRHFLAVGLTHRAHLRTALKQPPLCALKPDGVIGKVEEVAGHFATIGCIRSH